MPFHDAAPPDLVVALPGDGVEVSSDHPLIRIEYDPGDCTADMQEDCNPVPSTLVVDINDGANVTSDFTTTASYAQNGDDNGPGRNALTAGRWNKVHAKICNGLGLCTEAWAEVHVADGS